MQWSHCRFVDRLLWKAPHLGTTVLLNPEPYTLKMCGCCGRLNRGLLGSKVFNYPMCDIVMDRDVRKSRNIVLRTVADMDDSAIMLVVKEVFPVFIPDGIISSPPERA